MNIEIKNNKLYIDGVKDFEIGQTLECGQCFHFEKIDENDYACVCFDRLFRVKQNHENIEININKLLYDNKGKTKIINETSDEDVSLFINYFDLNRDYGKIKKHLLKKDKKLKKAIDEKWGIRILNQEFSETLMSFIISQNKQIPHIKKIVSDISRVHGVFLGEINGNEYYAFPDIININKITLDDYKALKTGFRAPYLKDASDKLVKYAEGLDNKLNNDSIDRDLNKATFNRIYIDELIKKYIFENLTNEEARDELKKIKGVGDKVANCVNLFALGKRDAFPVDVWIKRIMENLYFDREASKEEIEKYANDLYGEYGGYAQQYLFFYGRDNNIGK